LEARPPAKEVELAALMREFLLNDEQPSQTHSGFGQPELVAYHHSRFYIQLLFWMDGTTDIHQHEFSGAFHVMHGSSIHAHYTFENARAVTPHLRVGDVRMKKIELLETGRTVPIVSGPACIHSLFHLDTPSVTVVVRTQHDPGTGPQFNFLPPHIALDPEHSDTLTMRRQQLLDVLEQTGDAAYPELVAQMLADLDFERGFYILQHSMGHLREHDQWDSVVRAFRKKHGALAAGVEVTLLEDVRRNVIKEMRRSIAEPEHRFFLALLMNVSRSADLLKLVARRYPDDKPVETVVRWAQELAESSDDGVTILDAYFPATLDVGVDQQLDLMTDELRYLMSGSKNASPRLRRLSAPARKHLQDAFADSCLRVLMA
jgi:hypothetical protein